MHFYGDRPNNPSTDIKQYKYEQHWKTPRHIIYQRIANAVVITAAVAITAWAAWFVFIK